MSSGNTPRFTPPVAPAPAAADAQTPPVAPPASSDAPPAPPAENDVQTQPAPAVTTGRIVGAILQNGHIYKAGEEQALSSVLPQADMDRHIERKNLSGVWVSTFTPGEPKPTTSGRASRRGR